MNITIENNIKIIEMGDKGPNLLSVDRAQKIIQELNYDDCKAVIILGNEKVFSAGLNLKDLSNAKDPKDVSLIFSTLGNLLNANIAAAPIPGPANGNSTFQKACNLVHPSVLATSDISFGICLKKPSVNHIVNGTFIAT